MMDAHEQQEEALGKLISRKCFLAVSSIADDEVTTEFGWDEVHDAVDSFRRGMGKSKNTLWVAQYKGEEAAHVFLFVGKSYDDVVAKINPLPDKPSMEKRAAIMGKIKKLTGCDSVDWDSPDINECAFEMEQDTGEWHGKYVDGIRLRFRGVYKPKKRKKK